MLPAVLVLCVLQGGVQAEEGQPEPSNSSAATSAPVERQLGVKRGPLPVMAGIVPGLLAHGAGHYVGGDRKSAWSLLKWEGLGLGFIAGGVTGLALTGAARQTVGMLALLTVTGAGMFITSWLADLYGVLAPAGGWGSPLRVEPWLQARLGMRYMSDPTLGGEWFLGPALDLRFKRWRWSPGAWIAAGSQNMRFENALAYRAYGPLPASDKLALDGSYVDIVAGQFHHRYREEFSPALNSTFQITSVDVRVEARLDLQRILPSLTGSFVEGNAGAGLAAYHFPTPSATEASSVLLGGFGFGVYLGREPARWGQARMYYNHRHDDFAGGLKTPGLGSGALGHFGADLVAYLSQHWGFRTDVQAGSAWIVGLSALYRYGRVSS